MYGMQPGPTRVDKQAFSCPSKKRKEKAGRRQSGVNYERENVGIVFEDDNKNDIDNSMKVVNEIINKEGASIKMNVEDYSFIKHKTI